MMVGLLMYLTVVKGPIQDSFMLLLPIWFVGISISWYFNYGRLYAAETNGHSMSFRNMFKEHKIQLNKIVEIKKGKRMQVPFFRTVHLIRVKYTNRDGKIKSIRYLSRLIKNREIINVSIYKTLVPESKLVNF